MFKQLHLSVIALTVLLFFCSSGTHAESHASCQNAENVIGRLEYVVMQDVDVKLKARIDTGAGVSSIHVKILNIKPDQAGTGEIVTFQISDQAGELKTLRRKIVEWANIKIKASKKEERRPVVLLDFCLAGKKIEGRINLTDRSGFLYPVLIGRNILKTGDFLINPRRKFMRAPDCE